MQSSCHSARTHRLAQCRIAGKLQQLTGKPRRIALAHRHANPLALHQQTDLALWIADEHQRPPGGKDAVELAREHETFDLRPLRYQMHIADAQAEGQAGAILIGPELHVRQPPAADFVFDPAALRAAADEQERDRVRNARQALGRIENGIELMHTAQVPRIADDELAFQPPFTP